MKASELIKRTTKETQHHEEVVALQQEIEDINKGWKQACLMFCVCSFAIGFVVRVILG